MGQFFISAEDYEIGDGFAETPFTLTNSSPLLEVVSDGGRKAFRFTTNVVGSGRRTADLTHGLTVSGTCEIYAEQRGNAGSSDFHLLQFASGSGSSITGISTNNLDEFGQLRVCSFNPGFAVLDDETFAAAVAHKMRFRSNGTNSHKLFAWGMDDTEPSAPIIDDITAVSFAGSNVSWLSAQESSVAFIYCIGVGTQGDPAPTAPLGSTEIQTPDGLTTTLISSSSARAEWSAVTGADSYDIEWKLQSSGTLTGFADSITAVFYDITDLSQNQLYEWRVRATGGGVDSDWTDWQGFKTLVGPPTDLTETEITSSSVLLSWGVPI